ncbi:hypothetical protein D9C73_014688 [Collichthys lucidus]|uniref:Ig-like domain-containing protein n=1 Tax=Collichthys lucidus TaxID=240159 RepID=A0A4U5UYY7_COLLU|nr:hypothetical protein D9C73_014688 [Collichthys lucidus]
MTVAPTCRVKGHPEAELTLNCGDGKIAGVVQYWHTPFGDLQPPAFHSELDHVFMHSDGSLVVPNTSILHSGLYYCLLQHTEGTTLWPYKLHVGHDNQKNQEDSEHEQPHSSCGAFRFRRDVGSEAERQQGVSDEQFAGAVAASVLLTFVVGFSAGALSRTRVLRCLRAITTRLPSLQKQRCQTAACDSEVNMTDVPPERDRKDSEADTSTHSATSSPPAKPQRSFRHKQQQQEEERQETTAYLEGCDHTKEERRREEVAEGSLEEQNKACDEVTEEEEERMFYLSEDGGSQTETDEGECSEEREERDGRESKEEKEVEERSEEGGDRRGSVEEVGGNKEKGSDEKEGWKEEKEVEEERSEQREDRRESMEEREGEDEGGDEETDSCSEDDETGSQEQEDKIKRGTTEEEEPASPTPRPAHRIIRLYQYDDDGQRYAHLPEPAPTEPRPGPRLRQRSISLTRLSAIMAAASAGPLDEREGGKEERTHFHMEI